MSTVVPTVDDTQAAPKRVLACVLCQQRKIKCNRKFPCSNCINSRAKCTPAIQATRRRKRRFPEPELLNRLRLYEDLLREHNIAVQQLPKDPLDAIRERNFSNTAIGSGSDDDQTRPIVEPCSSPSITIKTERVYETKDIWRAMSEGFRDPENDSESSTDDIREAEVMTAWDQSFGNTDSLTFGTRNTNVDLSTLHPEPVQIFKLWQAYLDNVNPLLKVTHAPSLQGRIVEATGNISKISPDFEALLFGIYCMSITSLSIEDCQTIFHSSKDDLLTRYQFACQQALLNSGYLRTGDRECLTALFLYLISMRSHADPRSLSSMFGVAVRIAQRMGMHNESLYAEQTILEAEMRRRLWWSLILLDTRVSELAGDKTATLSPYWDCKIPLNVNDFDLRPEMRESPTIHGQSTEALFVAVRSEIGEFVRHATFHLDFTSATLRHIIKNTQHDQISEYDRLIALEKRIEDKYLNFCHAENPLHFFTIWTTRAYLAKCRLMEQYSKNADTSVRQTEIQRDAAISYAFKMLEADTKIMTSPLTKGYLWLANFNFPFLAYLHIVQDLRRRPYVAQAEQAWRVMSDNCEARFNVPGFDVTNTSDENSPLFHLFSKTVLLAWEAREAASKQSTTNFQVPNIVSYIKKSITRRTQNTQSRETGPLNDQRNIVVDDFMPMPLGNHSSLETMADNSGLPPSEFDGPQLNWTAMDWSLGKGSGW